MLENQEAELLLSVAYFLFAWGLLTWQADKTQFGYFRDITAIILTVWLMIVGLSYTHPDSVTRAAALIGGRQLGMISMVMVFVQAVFIWPREAKIRRRRPPPDPPVKPPSAPPPSDEDSSEE